MIAGALLLLAVVFFRIAVALAGHPEIAGLNNFSPLGALVLCGAAFLPRRWAVALPLATLFLSDLLLNAHYGVALLNVAMLPQYLAFALVAALGWTLRGTAPGGRIFGASIVSSVIFYVISNTGAWAVEPQYARGFAGWLQALTTGLSGYPPTWVLFRNTLLSDLVFTGLFVACVRAGGLSAAPVREVATA